MTLHPLPNFHSYLGSTEGGVLLGVADDGTAALTPKPRLAGPRFQAFARGRLLRPSRAVPVVLAGCVV